MNSCQLIQQSKQQHTTNVTTFYVKEPPLNRAAVSHKEPPLKRAAVSQKEPPLKKAAVSTKEPPIYRAAVSRNMK